MTDIPRPCGAKLRDGTPCAVLLPPGHGRCFKHGGAPRSGAPRGNSNAVKHGAYGDGGERKPPRRARDEAGMRELAQWALFNPVTATDASPAEQQRGRALAKTFEVVANRLKATLYRRTRLDQTSYSTLLAQQDVLELLLAAPSCFDSEMAYRCRVAAAFQTRFQARSKLRAVRHGDALGYS